MPGDLNALYIGGGFPETHAAALAANRTFLGSLRRAAEEGLPIYAECGGLMLLSRALTWKGARYEMADVFPFEVEVSETAQGHGYIELQVDTPNPFFAVGTSLRGHEFHYSRIVPQSDWTATACEVRRGTGCFKGRDAAIIRKCLGQLYPPARVGHAAVGAGFDRCGQEVCRSSRALRASASRMLVQDLVQKSMKSFLHTVDTQKSFEAAVEAVEAKVAENNFRVVNTYDVAATLTEQGFPRSPLKIIEVCNARFASEALEKDINVALMLPCPIAVYTEGGKLLSARCGLQLWLRSVPLRVWSKSPPRSIGWSSRLSMRQLVWLPCLREGNRPWLLVDAAVAPASSDSAQDKPCRLSRRRLALAAAVETHAENRRAAALPSAAAVNPPRQAAWRPSKSPAPPQS